MFLYHVQIIQRTHLQHVQQCRLASIVETQEEQLGVLVQQAQRGEDIVNYLSQENVSYSSCSELYPFFGIIIHRSQHSFFCLFGFDSCPSCLSPYLARRSLMFLSFHLLLFFERACRDGLFAQ